MKRLTTWTSMDGKAKLIVRDGTLSDKLIEQIAIQRLAEYEDAEEQGLLVRLPCKVGDTVYCIRRNPYAKGYYVKENKVLSIEWNGRYFTLFTTKEDVLGRTVFLNREAAEKALEDA